MSVRKSEKGFASLSGCLRAGGCAGGSGCGDGGIRIGNGGISLKGAGCCVAVEAEAMPRPRLGRPRGKRRGGFAGFSRQTARGKRKSMTRYK